MDAIILCWNETEITYDSAKRILKEGHNVIVVDNNSEGVSKELLRKIDHPNYTLLELPENMGASVGRNKGLEVSKAKYIFLLDGDILYVPGTIDEYAKVLDKYDDAFCVGQNSHKLLNELGHNGVFDPIQADQRMTTDYTVEDWFPMVWTQYGLFRGELRDIGFVTEGAFGEAGYGLEDDFLYHEIKTRNLSSLAVDKPIYYHHAHSGERELFKRGLQHKFKERKRIFQEKWGSASWAESIGDIDVRTTRDNPNKTKG